MSDVVVRNFARVFKKFENEDTIADRIGKCMNRIFVAWFEYARYFCVPYLRKPKNRDNMRQIIGTEIDSPEICSFLREIINNYMLLRNLMYQYLCFMVA